MARGATEQRRPVWLKLVVFGVMIVGGVALAAVFVPQFLFSQTAEVALIRGDDAPFKVKPQDTGGAKIPHQETTVMGMLGGVSASNQDVEILTPPAAVPEMPPAPVTDSGSVAVASEPALPTQVGSAPAAETKQPEPPQPVPSDGASSASEEKAVDLTVQQDERSVDEGKQGAEAAQGNASASLMAVPVQKPASTSGNNSNGRKISKQVDVEGDEPLYIVQLAAFREPGKAMEQAGLLGRSHAKRLNGVELGTMKIDTGDNGVFWRVVTEPLLRPEADALCAGLKRAGQDCILRKFTMLSQ